MTTSIITFLSIKLRFQQEQCVDVHDVVATAHGLPIDRKATNVTKCRLRSSYRVPDCGNSDFANGQQMGRLFEWHETSARFRMDQTAVRRNIFVEMVVVAYGDDKAFPTFGSS